MKENIQKLTKELALICLDNASAYHVYGEKDLENATIVFSHFLFDIAFTENQNLTSGEMLKLAETTGSAMRELILIVTGKDMHEIVKK